MCISDKFVTEFLLAFIIHIFIYFHIENYVFKHFKKYKLGSYLDTNSMILKVLNSQCLRPI